MLSILCKSESFVCIRKLINSDELWGDVLKNSVLARNVTINHRTCH